MSDELLSMFFDDEFVPHAYLDAFLSNNIKTRSSSTTSNTTTNLKNLSTIQSLQHNSSLLLSNLDFLTNELTNDLESKIHKLHNLNSIISYSYQNSDETSKLKPTSRLEYYIDSLLISIESLNETIESITSKINLLQSQPDSTMKNMINLSFAKTNLIKVLKFLELIKSIVEISHDENGISNGNLAPTTSNKNFIQKQQDIVISPLEFQTSLSILRDTIIEQFNNKLSNETKTEIDFEYLKKINNFINILPIFKNLNVFYNNYNDFVKKITKAKQNYLNLKDLDYFDDDDELFKQVLK